MKSIAFTQLAPIEISPSALGENSPCRLALYDNRAESYSFTEIPAGETTCIDLERLTHFNYRYKLQKRVDGKWSDITKFERLLPEQITPDGIKYLFYPSATSRKLIVVFQAMNVKPGYNYIRTLDTIDANQLFIKDDYGSDPTTHSSYYLGPQRQLDISLRTQHLIRSLCEHLRLTLEDCIFCGSSKGGFAALYHGFALGAGAVVAGGPQIKLGTFLFSRSKSSNLPPILEYLSGGREATDAAWADEILPGIMRNARNPSPKLFIHVGRGDPHYEKHILPFLAICDDLNIRQISLDIGEYSTHEELATHFPIYLHDTLQNLAGMPQKNIITIANDKPPAFTQSLHATPVYPVTIPTTPPAESNARLAPITPANIMFNRIRSAFSNQSQLTIQAATKRVFSCTIPLRKGFTLHLEEVRLAKGPTLTLLEDRIDLIAAASSREGGNYIYSSQDRGQQWVRLYPDTDFQGPISQVFTAADGSRLVRCQNIGKLFFFDPTGRLLQEQQLPSPHGWHGSQGIGQSRDGTILYSEYPSPDVPGQPLRVWRFRPGAAQWEQVFEQTAGQRPPQGDLRHFHVCTTTPAAPDTWILASGDMTTHCRLWTSRDNGNHWTEIKVKNFPLDISAASSSSANRLRISPFDIVRILRFTSINNATDGCYVWGTDDSLGVGRAALIKMRLEESAAHFEIAGWLGENYTRNIVALADDLFLTVSESKNNLSHIDFSIWDAITNSSFQFKIPNPRRAQLSTTASVGSFHTAAGSAFLKWNDGIFSNDPCRILKITIEE